MIRKIGVVGAGAMGSGIAQVAAMAGHSVVVYDAISAATERAAKMMESSLLKLENKGKIESSAGVMSNVKFVDDLNLLSDADFIIEAIIEELSAKKELFRALEKLVAADCVLATNTSSLSVTSIASACSMPERVIGVHFFNPATIMELVEIIPALQTEKSVLNRTTELISGWNKTAVICKDTPGFIVNRIARPYYGEALRILDEGIATCETIDEAMKRGGFRMGPFELMDFIGHDVNFRVTESVFQSFYFDPRYKPSFTQKRLFEAGWFGKKSGRGFYDYAENAVRNEPDLNENLQKSIFLRVISMLINEAADALHFRIATEEDIELAMKKGVNYPKGLIEWASEIGIQTIVEQLDILYSSYGEDRYRCSPALRVKLQNAV